MLAQSLVRLIQDNGGQIRSECMVERILVKHGAAVGVRTRTGETYRAKRAVIASTNPDQLYLHLLADADIAAPLKQQAERYRYGRGCVQIHLALSEPPRWQDERFDKVGLIHLTPGLDGCSQHINQALCGLLPADPTISMDVPTMLDPTRAPAGQATVRLQILEMPCHPRGDAAGKIDVGDGTWTSDLKQRFTERILSIVGRHAPNVPDAILGCHIISPDDLARFSPNLGPGDPYGGSHDIAQSYLLRPLPGQPSHRTAVPNVFMLGAATWPGHGINGGSGYIVAHHLLGTA
jgi:phytoene dehydrogenase-like protein